MTPFVQELVAICRDFGIMERSSVCCGDVTVPQCAALQLLLDGPSDTSSLAGSLGSTPSAATRLVDGLERSGWVTRARDEADRRRVWVSLTPAGARQAKRLRGLTEAELSNVLEKIPADKHAQVLESLTLLRRAVGESLQQLVGCCWPAQGGESEQ